MIFQSGYIGCKIFKAIWADISNFDVADLIIIDWLVWSLANYESQNLGISASNNSLKGSNKTEKESC